MKITNSIKIAFFSLLLISCVTDKSEVNKFISVDGQSFIKDGKPYAYVGTNFWYGAYLGQAGEGGNRDRLKKELDFLVEHGITNLRVLGASEEAVFENSLSPTFINTDGSYNEDLLVGLDYLLAEMAEREMYAVIFLNNYWEWSGGMSTYNGWFGDGPVIDPADGDWEAFMKYSARFYQNEAAQTAYRKYIRSLVTRTNTITGNPYFNDPAIMSWQLANEPRPGRGEMSPEAIQAYYDWIDGTAGFIKSLAPNQLVSSGSEGEKGSLDSIDIYVEAHKSENIDYLTFHMWAKNWGWIDPSDMENTYANAEEKAKEYIVTHVDIAKQLDKPIVMEEFGFPRDGESYNPNSSTIFRDKYYELVFSLVEENEVLSGTNFWSWGGFGEAQNEDFWWKKGDPFVGDPPQEPQGLNSVFANDSSTLEIIKVHSSRIN